MRGGCYEQTNPQKTWFLPNHYCDRLETSRSTKAPESRSLAGLDSDSHGALALLQLMEDELVTLAVQRECEKAARRLVDLSVVLE